MKLESKRKIRTHGFTLVELLIVISIIALLSSIVLLSVNTARVRARDAQRRSDLHQIANALELYYNKHGAYPSTGGTAPNDTNHSQYSLESNWLGPLVADGELPVAIKDPINIDYGPWCTNGYPDRSNTIYTYVSDGTHYVLCSWMENSTDPNTLQYHDVASPWNETKFMHADYSFGDHTTVIAR